MPLADMIFGEKDIAGPHHKRLAVGVANSSVPDRVITNWGSGSGCQSYAECAGVSLKWMAVILFVYGAFEHM